MHVLGIDAGGTKTVCLLADEHGHVLAEGRGPGANLHTAGELEAEKVLHDVMERALAGQDIRATAICVGIAGVDREDDSRIVNAIMRRIARGSRVLVVNDALVALTAGLRGDPSAPGVVIISGTGSIVYGRSGRGVAARAGGWGHVIGDEGSGYWMGRRALSAVVRAADGRGPATALTQEVLAHFQVSDPPALVRIVYDRSAGSAQHSIAMLGPILQRLRAQGDVVATDILDAAARELTAAARSVASRLEMLSESFPFFLSGGTFRAVPWLVEELARRLVALAPHADVRLLGEEPALGAVWLALQEARGGVQIPKYWGQTAV